MKKVRLGAALACEHIVMGGGGKPTLIGVFSGDIKLSSMPAKIWISLFVEVEMGGDDPIRNLKLEIQLDGQFVASFDAQPPDTIDSNLGNIVVPAGLLEVKTPGRIAFYASAENRARTEILSKRIIADVVAQ